MKRSKGFTLVELLVVVGIIAMLVSILMPTLGRAREIARMSMCAASLNGIGKGIQIFMAEDEAGFPLLPGRSDTDDLMADLTSSTDFDDVNDLNKNAMQNVWILIQTGTLQEEHFKCPSQNGYEARKDVDSGTALKKYGWNSWNNFGVGMHKPYGGTGHKSQLTGSAPRGSFVTFADRNYQSDNNAGTVHYTSSTSSVKPGNHPRDGINYLPYGSSCGRARYKETTLNDRTSACGTAGDDIYVAGDDGSSSAGSALFSADPSLDTDTFILPWDG